MGVTLLTTNLLEAAASAITSTPTASALRLARLSDRSRSVTFQGGNRRRLGGLFPITINAARPSEWIIDVDLGAAQAVTAWAVINTNVTGVTVTLKGDSSSPPTTVRDSVDPAAADVFRTFASLSLRYWRLTIPTPGFAPTLGELFLGVYSTLPEPEYGSEEENQGNTRVDESPAGVEHATQKGDPRYSLLYRWVLTDAQWATLLAAHQAAQQNVRGFPVLDNDSTVRWVKFAQPNLRRRRRFDDQNEADVELRVML